MTRSEAIALRALLKHLEDLRDELDKKIPDGTEQHAELELRFAATIAKGQSTTQAGTPAILNICTIALLLAELGVKGERAENALEHVFERTFEITDSDKDTLMADHPWVAQAHAKVKRAVQERLPRIEKRAPVRIAAPSLTVL